MSSMFLIYISRAVVPLDEADVKYLAQTSAAKNHQNNITGLLLQVGNYFIQVLEGEHGVVTSLLEKIACDVRHTDVRTIYRSANTNRIFDRWNMGFFNIEQHYTLNRLDLEGLKRYVGEVFAQNGASPDGLVQVIRTLPALMETSRTNTPAMSQ